MIADMGFSTLEKKTPGLSEDLYKLLQAILEVSASHFSNTIYNSE